MTEHESVRRSSCGVNAQDSGWLRVTWKERWMNLAQLCHPARCCSNSPAMVCYVLMDCQAEGYKSCCCGQSVTHTGLPVLYSIFHGCLKQQAMICLIFVSASTHSHLEAAQYNPSPVCWSGFSVLLNVFSAGVTREGQTLSLSRPDLSCWSGDWTGDLQITNPRTDCIDWDCKAWSLWLLLTDISCLYVNV